MRNGTMNQFRPDALSVSAIQRTPFSGPISR